MLSVSWSTTSGSGYLDRATTTITTTIVTTKGKAVYVTDNIFDRTNTQWYKSSQFAPLVVRLGSEVSNGH